MLINNQARIGRRNWGKHFLLKGSGLKDPKTGSVSACRINHAIDSLQRWQIGFWANGN